MFVFELMCLSLPSTDRSPGDKANNQWGHAFTGKNSPKNACDSARFNQKNTRKTLLGVASRKMMSTLSTIPCEKNNVHCILPQLAVMSPNTG